MDYYYSTRITFILWTIYILMHNYSAFIYILFPSTVWVCYDYRNMWIMNSQNIILLFMFYITLYSNNVVFCILNIGPLPVHIVPYWFIVHILVELWMTILYLNLEFNRYFEIYLLDLHICKIYCHLRECHWLPLHRQFLTVLRFVQFSQGLIRWVHVFVFLFSWCSYNYVTVGCYQFLYSTLYSCQFLPNKEVV